MKKGLIIFTSISLALIGFRFFGNMQMSAKSHRPNQAPSVEVQMPKRVDIINKKEVIGRVEAKYTTNIITRVSGYLQDRYFKEGDVVKKGQLLFKIQPNDFIVNVNQAKANLENTNSALIAAEKNLSRISELIKNDYISKSEYDNALANRDSLKASLQAQKALLDKANLNLSYTSIKAPISGKIGKVLINKGNYIDRSSGTLATIVSVDPIYVSFNINSDEYLLAKQQNSDTFNLVELVLPNNEIYEEQGIVDFSDNNIDETTGTIKLRATFKNPKGLLLPGQFVNLKVVSNKAEPKLLIPQDAIIVNPGGKFVYVVDAENTAKMRPVKIGIQQDNNIVIEQGLSPEDRVITNGVLKVRPEVKVNIITPKTEEKDASKEAKQDV